ncbi:MAG: hypothetical protein GOVbin2700_23 [Prokaryotic dsDNA virus sp.]|jgi:hypothetical protein|nr:MAG: hypothetical protein GOVbin2700_23 [Prokaryotic dsDNA virus sp.]|tara:strand:- start:269 stop:655 length:387 start_codon:yes stop_codon:yes gene_type:complete
MANRKRGYYSIKMGGKNRTMHFSMNFWANFTDELNVPIEQIGEIFQKGISLSSIRALIYSALLAFDQEEGNEIDYTIYKVGSWLDELPAEKIEEIVGAMMESKILGNELNVGIKRNVEKSTKKSSKGK